MQGEDLVAKVLDAYLASVDVFLLGLLALALVLALVMAVLWSMPVD